MHKAAIQGHVPVLEVLCDHAPATLEAKDNVRLSVVFVCILPHVGGGEAGWIHTAPRCST